MNLYQLRKQRGISRARLAADVGTSYSNIVSLETGRSKPRIDLAMEIARYFGVPVESIEWGVKPDTSDDDDAGKGVSTAVA